MSERIIISDDRLLEAVKNSMFGTDNPGFCLACGADHDECEPDARNYQCYECRKSEVFGAEEILVMQGGVTCSTQ